ncbi:hypothetical protein ACFL5F_07330, partial [Planctomycetota bacterium]
IPCKGLDAKLIFVNYIYLVGQVKAGGLIPTPSVAPIHSSILLQPVEVTSIFSQFVYIENYPKTGK